jgi:branched-chain amino acid aminotransferase
MRKEYLVYIDGEYYSKSNAKVSVYDHGLLYGDGIFEGIRAYNGVVFKLKEHIDRLYSSAHAIMLKIPITKGDLTKAVLETLRKNGLKDAYIRLVVTRGFGDLGLDPRRSKKPTIIIITEEMGPLYGAESKEKGVTAIITWVRRDSVNGTTHEIKSLNYLNSVLAKIEANNAGVDEAIFLDNRGFICEGTGENIFVIKNERLVTPPRTAGILLGITRDIVMSIARKLGYVVLERNITPSELLDADEVFLSGTAAEVIPVVEINKRKIGNGKEGTVTKRLVQEFSRIIMDPKEGTKIM